MTHRPIHGHRDHAPGRRRPLARRGDVMVEYAIVVAGVALVALTGVAYVSEPVAGLVGVSAQTGMPGAHPNDNGPLGSDFLVEMRADPTRGLTVDYDEISNRSDGATGRLAEQLGVDSASNPFPDQIINAQIP